ncbi:hypothetical protein CROQUDRAFT_674424 [Cronartium quercuum f. sp. fusiforme G11]|uniref:RRM domain-containing protein n=1 Tax=Cronartium quercuum f. sp. fusiforme G11 TaxID=708437 RepID=A0A9P6T6S6_9BASI|nr:hypothetical protein CROQUDRAFT_674424 [Cronartium quercuum f. sp. fusiforme G11]
MSKTKVETKKVTSGENQKKSLKPASLDKPKRKKVTVLEPAPVDSLPKANATATKEGLSPDKSVKPIKSTLKPSKSNFNSKKAIRFEVVDQDNPSKSKKKYPSDAAASKDDRTNKSKTNPSTSCTTQFPDHEDQILLKGLETELSDEADDSSDDEDDESLDQTADFDPRDLPKATKRQKAKEPTDKAESAVDNSGVVYLGRIPHGFHEEEMTQYFNQFGETRRVRLSRNRRTGRSKHYGFIEFKHREVAQIVAETLQGYLLCGNMLQCKLLEKDEVHPRLWVGSGRKFRKDWKPRHAREKHNQPKSEDQQKIIADRLIKREDAKRKRFEELGITYDFPGYCSPVEPTKPAKSSKKAKTKGSNDTEPVKVLKAVSSTSSGAKVSDSVPTEKSKSQKKKKARKST